jgi:hypothetical protein
MMMTVIVFLAVSAAGAVGLRGFVGAGLAKRVPVISNLGLILAAGLVRGVMGVTRIRARVVHIEGDGDAVRILQRNEKPSLGHPRAAFGRRSLARALRWRRGGAT